MTILKAPLLSLKAHGSLGKRLTFQKKGNLTIARKKPIPTDPKSDKQLWHRYLYEQACQSWHTLTPTQQLVWETNARPYHMTGFALFMRAELKRLANLVLCLPFTEGKGIITSDYSSHLNHATIYGASWTSWYDNLHALAFDGNDDEINCGNRPNLNLQDEFSFLFWIKPDLTVNNRTVFQRGRYQVDGYEVCIYNTGLIFITVYQAGADQWWYNSTFLTHNVWQQVAFVKKGAVGYAYRNAIEATIGKFPLINPVSNTRPFIIGRSWEALKPFKGSITDFWAYNTAVSLTEVEYHYERRHPI